MKTTYPTRGSRWASALALSLAALLVGAVAYASAQPRAVTAKAWKALGVVEVDVSQLRFSEMELRVAAGTKVRWVNKDPIPHTVTSDDEVWDSPLMASGETYERIFDEPGEYSYHCAPHPFMKGIVIVEGHAPPRSVGSE